MLFKNLTLDEWEVLVTLLIDLFSLSVQVVLVYGLFLIVV
jgi:hypothetical protein